MVGNPFRFLEGSERRGFWDVRVSFSTCFFCWLAYRLMVIFVQGKRKEFADWVRDGSKGDVKVTQ